MERQCKGDVLGHVIIRKNVSAQVFTFAFTLVFLTSYKIIINPHSQQ